MTAPTRAEFDTGTFYWTLTATKPPHVQIAHQFDAGKFVDAEHRATVSRLRHVKKGQWTAVRVNQREVSRKLWRALLFGCNGISGGRLNDIYMSSPRGVAWLHGCLDLVTSDSYHESKVIYMPSKALGVRSR